MKKASLQLSINAIVVLILAITILGLGLGFIKTQFGGITKQFGAVSEEIQAQMIDKIKESGELVTFNTLQFELQRGKDKQLYMGIRNTGDSNCFYVRFLCVDSIATGVTDEACPDMETTTTSWNWFTTFEQKFIEGGDIAVLPIKVQTQGNPPAGTYNGKVEVRVPATQDISCQQGFDSSQQHASKEFFIEVR